MFSSYNLYIPTALVSVLFCSSIYIKTIYIPLYLSSNSPTDDNLSIDFNTKTVEYIEWCTLMWPCLSHLLSCSTETHIEQRGAGRGDPSLTNRESGQIFSGLKWLPVPFKSRSGVAKCSRYWVNTIFTPSKGT